MPVDCHSQFSQLPSSKGITSPSNKSPKTNIPSAATDESTPNFIEEVEEDIETSLDEPVLTVP